MNHSFPTEDPRDRIRSESESAAEPSASGTTPVSPPIELTSVWQCQTPEQADALLGGELDGYVYRRDGHPNADRLGRACQARHGAAWCHVTNSGMSAIATTLLSELASGDHVLLADELYGKTRRLIAVEGGRWGLTADSVDAVTLDGCCDAYSRRTRMLLVETISNPTLRVPDIAQLAGWCREHELRLVVDHTFGTPLKYSPLQDGADIVVESLTKFANGHSDVVLGMVAGRGAEAGRYGEVMRAWGFVSSPFDCWLAERGLATLDVRAERACENALRIAQWLEAQAGVENVRYPGLPSHPDHATAVKQFGSRFGTMIAFDLPAGLDGVRRLVRHIPFCPSLGEVVTTVSHPRTTSHRSWSDEECVQLGIEPGTVRLSVGCEPFEELRDRMTRALQDACH